MNLLAELSDILLDLPAFLHEYVIDLTETEVGRIALAVLAALMMTSGVWVLQLTLVASGLLIPALIATVVATPFVAIGLIVEWDVVIHIRRPVIRVRVEINSQPQYAL